jgi:hypothetical protein
MLRILTLDWTKVCESDKAKAQGRLLRYIAAHGGMLSEDNQIFVTEDLDKPKEYKILKSVFTNNNIAAYERVNVSGFDGAGRVF